MGAEVLRCWDKEMQICTDAVVQRCRRGVSASVRWVQSRFKAGARWVQHRCKAMQGRCLCKKAVQGGCRCLCRWCRCRCLRRWRWRCRCRRYVQV